MLTGPGAGGISNATQRWFEGTSVGSRLYVGNLADSVRDDALALAFTAFGTVSSATVMIDADTGRSKGFAIVEMTSDAQAQAAISGMDGQPLEGHQIIVEPVCLRQHKAARRDGFASGP